MLKPLGIRKQLVAHVAADICLQAMHVLLHELLWLIGKVTKRQRSLQIYLPTHGKQLVAACAQSFTQGTTPIHPRLLER
jgi:predicted dienelactone hydrolase